jgi:hypothetical protein
MHNTSSQQPRTLFAKIWDAHVIREEPGQGTLLYIDRHMLNEVTTPQPFASLRVALHAEHGDCSSWLSGAVTFWEGSLKKVNVGELACCSYGLTI